MTDRVTQEKWDAASRTFDLFTFADDRRLGPHKRRLFQKIRGATLMVAAGTGNDFKFFPPNLQLIAIDISPRMLERAARKAAAYQGSIDLREMDVWLSNFADDAVFVFPTGDQVAGKKALGEWRAKSFGGGTGDSKRRHWVSGVMLTPMPEGIAKARAYWLMLDASGKQPVVAQKQGERERAQR